ncbi:MAG: helicase-associated domain-containing protein [Eubacteriaceae bacterium]|nr:helicase-associated domain-containing protein [Eubacteriaceae bacterium]
MSGSYEELAAPDTQAADGQLLVLADYTVVISGLKPRIEHETYLSKFLSKISDDENAVIYKINFNSIAKAHSAGISPKKLKGYLEKASSEPLPANVARAFDDWQAKAGRIKIRHLAVLETDDAILLEEIKHMKGMGKVITSQLKKLGVNK